MVFNSSTFLFFFSLLFLLYWFVVNRNLKLQNLLLLVGSYIFYTWSDWHLFFFLVGASVVTFVLGIYLERASSAGGKKLFLYLGLFQGIGGLVFLKYYGFFNSTTILVPIGISFYTFRTVSYLLDIEKGKIKATTDWLVYFSYVAFFPSLLSGPIDRASSFIPQLEKERTFDYKQATEGLRQIVWGLFKKVVIADNCAMLTPDLFHSYQDLPASSLLLGTFLFTIQIYADFSGYSDMAIGISGLLGFRGTKNFAFPLFAQNIAEFWRKWHISLTSLITEYVFSPLSVAFRDYHKFGLILSIVISFTLIGAWHGANWTYVLFGFLHGCYFIPLILKGSMNKVKKIAVGKWFPTVREFLNITVTFILVSLTFIVFRAESLIQAGNHYKRLFSASVFSVPVIPVVLKPTALFLFLFILILLVVEWLGRDGDFALSEIDTRWSRPLRWAFYYGIIAIIFVFAHSNQKFIYFQF